MSTVSHYLESVLARFALNVTVLAPDLGEPTSKQYNALVTNGQRCAGGWNNNNHIVSLTNVSNIQDISDKLSLTEDSKARR
jgi:hypothetical protein